MKLDDLYRQCVCQNPVVNENIIETVWQCTCKRPPRFVKNTCQCKSWSNNSRRPTNDIKPWRQTSPWQCQSRFVSEKTWQCPVALRRRFCQCDSSGDCQCRFHTDVCTWPEQESPVETSRRWQWQGQNACWQWHNSETGRVWQWHQDGMQTPWQWPENGMWLCQSETWQWQRTSELPSCRT